MFFTKAEALPSLSTDHGVVPILGVNAQAAAAHFLRQDAVPMLQRATDSAGALARRSIDAVRDGTYELRQQARQAGDSTVDYIRDEPVKSVVIAIAVGAALMALVALLGRSRHRA